jgi:nitrate reductase gamma subunit
MVPYFVAYASVLVFVVAVIGRFFMWSRMPLHMRWELYPVAHEAKRAGYGGSYLEESDWWKKPREVSLIGELKVMIPEIFFLVALKEHNRKLWTFSFPFHFGLYLVICCLVLALVNGILGGYAPSLVEGGFGGLLDSLVAITGWGGLVLGLLGAIGLLHRRIGSSELRRYASPADVFNLVCFLVAFGFSILSFALTDPGLSSASIFAQGFVTFELTALPGLMAGISVVLLSLLLAYIPLTHMSHFVGKYFAYHAIRWNDEPNLPGGEQEATIGGLLSQPVSWSAPHIQGDGKKTWGDVATKEMKKQ